MLNVKIEIPSRRKNPMLCSGVASIRKVKPSANWKRLPHRVAGMGCALHGLSLSARQEWERAGVK